MVASELEKLWHKQWGWVPLKDLSRLIVFCIVSSIFGKQDMPCVTKQYKVRQITAPVSNVVWEITKLANCTYE